MAQRTFRLNTGAEIPAVGLGTWQSPPGAVAAAVEHALKTGYRHIDGALCYGNEKEVGAGLKAGFDSGIKREDVFVTTKLWSTHHRDVEKAIDTSLADLGLDYVDLYLIHWPVAMNQNGNHPLFPKLPDGSRDIDHDRKHTDTWKDMEKLLETGKTKAVGVCNYSAKYLQELLDIATTKPTVNQIENHPLLPQEEILELAKANGILVTAYSPLGSADSPLLKDEDVVRIAEKHSVEPANVLIGYGLARGNAVIPKSVTNSRIESNFKLVKLDGDDVKALDGIHKRDGVKRFVYPPFGINFGFPDKQ